MAIVLAYSGIWVATNGSMIIWMKIQTEIKCFVLFIQYLGVFFLTAFSKKGLGNKNGRILILGKFRRMILASVPGLPAYLQKKYQISGGCVQCGASCKILFQCPQWDEKSNLCLVYENRPSVCRTFPITPADLRDRDLIMHSPCGFKVGEETEDDEDELEAPGLDVKERRFPV